LLLREKLAEDSNWKVKAFLTRQIEIPLIVAFFKPLQISVDITFTSGAAVQNSLLLAHLFEVQPEAAKFCFLIKHMLRVTKRKLNIRNYVIVMLCIFYLQNRNFLPSIEFVQRFADKLLVDGKIKK
jgi:DNA polymerase sigma